MADEYISREAAYDTLTEYYHHSTDTQHGALREALSRVPAADVRPVVLCKDCKYGVPTKNGFHNDMIACENKDSPCGYSSWLCQLDWFCADGERRVDDED